MHKVLIVDDSDLARQMLLSIFAVSDDFSVVGIAENGKDGLEKACLLKPDLITMALHMPVMDGYEAVEQIMSTVPVPILVITSSTEAEAAFKCVALGALDVIDKPAFYNLDDDSYVQRFLERARLFATTKVHRMIVSSHCRYPVEPPEISEQAASQAEASCSEFSVDTCQSIVSTSDDIFEDRPAENLVAIASSTGGPQALCQLLSTLPPDFPAAILIVQHLSAGFEEGFATWLGRHTELAVSVALDGAPLLPGTVLLAPPGKHIVISESKMVKYYNAPPVASHIPSARYLFESAAAVYGPRSTGVILTGMGSDGSEEIGRIQSAGGLTIGQDEASSIIFGMPGVAAKLGTVTEIMPLEDIAERIVGWVCR